MMYQTCPADGPHFMPANLFTVDAGMFTAHPGDNSARFEHSRDVAGQDLDAALASPFSGLTGLWPHLSI